MKGQKISKIGMLALLMVIMLPIVAMTTNSQNFMDFIKNYIRPIDAKVNNNYTYPLPEGYTKTSDMIIQAEVGDCFSTNILSTHENAAGINVGVTYKNSQNKVTGKFIRLNGTASAVKYGYPSLRTDFPILNVNTKTGEIIPIYSFCVMMLPQASAEQFDVFFDCISEKITALGMIPPTPASNPTLPVWWGPIVNIKWDGIDIDKSKTFRDIALSCYEDVVAQTDEVPDFDYRPLQERMIFDQSKSERHLFADILGIDVPVAAQRAFFAGTTYVPGE